MRKLLTRAGVSALAAAALSLATTTLAHADRPIYQAYCSGTIALTPEISAQTCVHHTIGYDDFAYATIRLTNNSGYVVTTKADLMWGSSSVLGDYVTVQPHSAGGANSPELLNPPIDPAYMTGRGYVQAGNWSTYTYNH